MVENCKIENKNKEDARKHSTEAAILGLDKTNYNK